MLTRAYPHENRILRGRIREDGLVKLFADGGYAGDKLASAISHI
jgi:hypothetical protein